MAEDYKLKEAQHKAAYEKMNKEELLQAFYFIRIQHTKETMMEDLVKMSALMSVMKERGIPVPGENQGAGTSTRQATASYGAANTTNRNYGNSQSYTESGPSWGKVVVGFIIMMVGIVITMGSGGQAIMYGAILVGFFMMIGGFIG